MESLGIKSERSKARFRELSERVETLSKALESAGIEDVQSLPELVQRAKSGEDLIGMVMETGADHQQFGLALDILSKSNAALSGDMKAAESLYEFHMNELAAWGKVLGREAPGTDPLADHPDLRDEVESGDLPRKRALEIASVRNQDRLRQANAERVSEREGQGKQQQAAVEAARTEIAAWDAEMLRNDPSYRARRATLDAEVARIRATKPPQEWLRETVLAYARIPAPAPAHVPPPGPVRGNRGTQGMQPQFKSVEEALDYGIDSVR